MITYLYALIIYPIEMLIETVFSLSMKMVPSAGYAIIFVSIAVQLLALPMYKRADEIQEEERRKQKELSEWTTHIKKTFKGDEQLMILSEYYRQNDYQPWYSLKGMFPLLLQIPFFIAAYHFLSNCEALKGAAFYFIKDMGTPDQMITISGVSINVLPILMTLINLASGFIYTRELALKDRVQLILTAGIFLVLLYNSPSGLVFYWTLNNCFSLLKNIFMKLVKHPHIIISAGSVLFACVYCYKCYTYGKWEEESGRIVMITVFLLGLIPLAGMLFEKIRPTKTADDVNRDERQVFILSAIILAVTTGALIPIAVFASSPTEFVIKGFYVNPLYQAVYSFVTAVGIFVLWGSIFFVFNTINAQKRMCIVMFVLSVCTLVDSQFFREHLNNMSIHMFYNRIIEITTRQKMINLAVLIVTCCICFFMYRKSIKVTEQVITVLLTVVVVMTGYNIYLVQKTLDNTPHIKDDKYYTESNVHFTLDRNGKNVVVLFLDRALGPYVPYIFNERPELAEEYSGFTYYPNTVAYGPHTETGGPPIMGGYEYTPYNMKDMTGDEYYAFQRTSLDVMPALFSKNGYKCSVLDPILDLGKETIEDYYHRISPDIDVYQADGVLRTEEEAKRDYDYFEKTARRTYIRHSFFLASPLFLRMFIYDDGSFNMQKKVDESLTLRGHLAELDMLKNMTAITDTGEGTFTFIANETPHSINADLQMPDYTVEDTVDNSEYLSEWRSMLSETPGVGSINMYTDWAIQSYEVNIASFISIGKWLEYLKEAGLYDNTRIIIVSDHGFFYFAFDDVMFDKGDDITDLERVLPVLMVKDFGDGVYSVSDEFMTNADVPVIAMKGLIDDPVNPNTGKPITDRQKYERAQFVFDDNDWLSVHDDVRDLGNWKVEDIEFKNKDIIMND